MTTAEPSRVSKQPPTRDLWERFASSIGITKERKQQIYSEVSRSATLADPSYWLQILFSAAIATLGLALDSPAVIIGAMLISPLMGPILAAGLALAAGDLELGARALLNLALSCLLAVFSALILVSLLPFKEITAEIAARVRPTTLDLFVALLSGAVGSLAVCKEAKGVATSIPGVAIAVALMPPLCVAGYGLGVAVSLDSAEGMRVARGGSLLFLTNLVAITFTAMLVFLALRVAPRGARERARRAAREAGREGRPGFLGRLPVSVRLPVLGSLTGRFVLVCGLLLLIWHPLSRSFNELRSEIAKKREENRLQLATARIWQQRFAVLPNGRPRSYLGQIAATDQAGRLRLQLRVFTRRSYTAAEKAELVRALAHEMHRQPASVDLQLIEVPTTSAELASREREAPAPKAAPTPAELHAGLLQIVDGALREIRLPPPAQLTDYQVALSPGRPLRLTLFYLSDRDIGPDAQFVIADEAGSRIGEPGTEVSLARIAAAQGSIPFRRNEVELASEAAAALDAVGELLDEHPALRMEVAALAAAGEREGIAEERAQAIEGYLAGRWRIAAERLARVPAPAEAAGPAAEIRLVLGTETAFTATASADDEGGRQ
ncbi:MAG TPA: DUF389 domain-containing protein [Thermoanaerobaculia bacterium]